MSAAFSRCSFQFPRYSSAKLEVRDLDLAGWRAVDEIVDDLRHLPEMVDQRFRIFVQRCEHEAAVNGDAADPLHMVLRVVESEGFGIALAVRHRVERAVRPERPSMIWTTEHLGVAAVDHADSRATMRAAVLQHVDIPVGMTGDKNFEGGEPGADEVTRHFELALMGDINPQPAEDALLLELEHGGVGVGAAMHMVRPYQAPDFVRCQR